MRVFGLRCRKGGSLFGALRKVRFEPRSPALFHPRHALARRCILMRRASVPLRCASPTRLSISPILFLAHLSLLHARALIERLLAQRALVLSLACSCVRVAVSAPPRAACRVPASCVLCLHRAFVRRLGPRRRRQAYPLRVLDGACARVFPPPKLSLPTRGAPLRAAPRAAPRMPPRAASRE